MAPIEIGWDVARKRGQQISLLMRNLSRNKRGPVCQAKNFGPREYIIATHDGSATSSRYTDWRFATIHPQFRALYYEMWHINNKSLALEKAYLHLYKINVSRRDDTEYLFLHCDPNEPAGSKHFHYKRGPHLHIRVAEQPIPHSHIALCYLNVDDVLLSLDSLSKAMEKCTEIIRDQFLALANE